MCYSPLTDSRSYVNKALNLSTYSNSTSFNHGENRPIGVDLQFAIHNPTSGPFIGTYADGGAVSPQEMLRDIQKVEWDSRTN
jgi:hypothetical protein